MNLTTDTITTLVDEATGIPVELTMTSFHSAAECNAQSEMSLPTLTQRLIDVATAHANALGVGYADLVKDNMGWVLSRISLEMTRMPGINETYSITTWVEGLNRRFSARNFQISDSNGNTIGYARSIWVAIDFTTRRPADISHILGRIIPSKRECPIEPLPRLAEITEASRSINHHFNFSDIDFNRHVNTCRYIETIINQWDVDFYDRNRVGRFDIVFLAEVHFADDVEILIEPDGDATFNIAIAKASGIATRARMTLSPRQSPTK